MMAPKDATINIVSKSSDRKITLDTGRVVFVRKPKWSDVRQASAIATSKGSFDPMTYLQELITLIITGLFRANGEQVDITNKAGLFDKILDVSEAQQMSNNPASLGIELEKKAPKVELLKITQS